MRVEHNIQLINAFRQEIHENFQINNYKWLSEYNYYLDYNTDILYFKWDYYNLIVV